MNLISKFLLTLYTLALLCVAALPLTTGQAFAAGTNLITNPSVETSDPKSGNTPQGWLDGGWGTNSASYSYTNTGHTGSRSVQVQIKRYTSGDAKWYFTPVPVTAGTSYTFSDYYQSNIANDVVAQFDDGAGNYTYQDLGVASAASTWQQYQAAFTVPAAAKNVTVFHLITGVGKLTTDDFSLTASSAGTGQTAPIVAITSPQNGTTVSNKTTLSATATPQGGNAIKNVQFKIDGQAIGSPITAAPYNFTWDTSGYGNGTHTVTAVATAADNQTATTSDSITVGNVSNVDMTNLVSNSSAETADTSNSGEPLGWYQGNWGNNTAKFSYLATGHTGNHSLRIAMSNYRDGGANWAYDSVPVQPGQVYEYNDYYQSNASTQVLVTVQMSDGSTQYIWLGDPYISDGTWTRFFASFTMPADAVSAVANHNIIGNGYLTTDDYDFQVYTPQGFTNPMVSVTFDDGIASQYNNGLPILQKYGLNGTFYIISGNLGLCDPHISSICYMTGAQIQGLQSAKQEIGSHTVDHLDLTTLTSAQVTQELSNSQTALQNLLGGASVTDFATPYGDVNLNVLQSVSQYYVSQRGVQAGYNSVDNYNQMDLYVQDIDSDTTVAQFKSYIDYAKATNTWLILVYHDINTNQSVDPGYDTTPADFDSEMAYLKASGVTVDTISQALTTVSPQVK